ncbi:MAG: hypothetical protein QHJ73_09655, partial [Armatimonadota bacterium]|nr:hypothetical protein [Armatimonadota bacterium]
WERQGLLLLTAGTHTLRLQCAGPIPHLAALALCLHRRISPETPLDELPPEAFVRDLFPIQDWPVHSVSGVQEYSVQQGEFVIRNGRHAFNRPLYGGPGVFIPFTGDRPVWLMAEVGAARLGTLSLAAGSLWLHRAEAIESAYDAGRMRHLVRDPSLGPNGITITALPLPESGGCLLELRAAAPVCLEWRFGGLEEGFSTSWWSGSGCSEHAPASQEHRDRVHLRNGTLFLTANHLPNRVAAVKATGESYRVELPAARDSLVPGRVGGLLPLGEEPVYLLLAAGEGTPETLAVPDPDAALFCRAEERWRSRAGRVTVTTPVPELDAAVRSNNAALDGVWRTPSSLAGVCCGTQRGGCLAMRGWYGPLCAGDHDQVGQAIRSHASHYLAKCPEGAQRGGALPVQADLPDEGERTEYILNHAFLDQVRYYYAWTGDLETLRALWPAMKRCLEYNRGDKDAHGKALCTKHPNSDVSHVHHLEAFCTLSSASLYRLYRFAAEAAAALGEDPRPFREEAKRIREAAFKELWMPDEGHFAEYRDRDGILHPAATAPSTCLPIDSGLTSPAEAVRAMHYLTRRLWSAGDQILVKDWFPVTSANGCFSHSENLCCALAYFQTGDVERGWRLLHTVAGAFRRARVPGSISAYAGTDGAQGAHPNCADTVSLFTRAVVEGLFGLMPDFPRRTVRWSPRFPPDWPRASLQTAGFRLEYQRAGTTDHYTLETTARLAALFTLPLRFDRVKSVSLNGRPVPFRSEMGLCRQWIVVRAPEGRRHVVTVTYAARTRHHVSAPGRGWALLGEAAVLSTSAGRWSAVDDPEKCLSTYHLNGSRLELHFRNTGRHTVLARLKLPHGEALYPLSMTVRPPCELVKTRLLTTAAFPGRFWLQVTLRANRLEPVAPVVEVFFAGRTYRGRMAASARNPAAAGSEETFCWAVENPERLSPGRMRLTVTLRGAGDPVVLEGETRLWQLFQTWPAGQEAFAARCRPLVIPRNACLETLFTRPGTEADLPFLNRGTCCETTYINL